MIFSASPNVFTDHLAVTYAPEDSPIQDLRTFLVTQGATAIQPKKAAYGYTLGKLKGLILIFENTRFVKIQIHGNALSYLRSVGMFGDVLEILSLCPHNITRLDAALDVPMDYPVFREKLLTAFPDYKVSLGRKAQVLMETYLTARADKKLTSTFYIGKRGFGKQMARIYDKQYELLQNRGELVPPLTRIELEVSREYGATLKDAFNPTDLFYHATGESLFVDALPEVRPWTSENACAWRSRPRVAPDPYKTLKRVIAESDDLRTMVELASSIGRSGFTTLHSLLDSYLEEAERPASVETITHGASLDAQ